MEGFAFINYASFEAADAAIEAMNGQYLCNRAISVSYAFKKDSKGERHGSAAERLLAAQNPLSQADRPHQLFADAPPVPVPPMMGGMPPPPGIPGMPMSMPPRPSEPGAGKGPFGMFPPPPPPPGPPQPGWGPPPPPSMRPPMPPMPPSRPPMPPMVRPPMPPMPPMPPGPPSAS